MGNKETKKMLQNLMNDPEYKTKLIDSVLDRTIMRADIVNDIIEEVADILEDDPDFKKALVKKVLSSEETRERVVAALIEELE